MNALSIFSTLSGEPLEVCQRAVAGAEVIDGDKDTQVRECAHGFGRRLHVAHQDALGDLDDEEARLDTRRLENDRHRFGEIRLGELTCREVHGDVEMRQVRELIVPATQLPRGLAEHELAQGSDQAALFSHRDELGRIDEPTYGVLPSHQAPRVPECHRWRRRRRVGSTPGVLPTRSPRRSSTSVSTRYRALARIA